MAVRFCADVAVSGSVLWHRASGSVHAVIRYGSTHAHLVWSLATLAPARLRGHATGRASRPSRCS
jgi:hypothetical protein